MGSAGDPVDVIRRRFERAAATEPAPASRQELAERAGRLGDDASSGTGPGTGGRYILDILQRQADAMHYMQNTFTNATGAHSPASPGVGDPYPGTFPDATGAQSPVTRVTTQVGIAWNVLPDRPLETADFTAAYAGVAAVAGYLGQELTPEQADDVQRGVEEIQADPGLGGKIRRAVEHVDWTKIRDMSATAVLTAVAVWLVRYSDSGSVLVTNHLTALILIVAIAALIVSMQKKDL